MILSLKTCAGGELDIDFIDCFFLALQVKKERKKWGKARLPFISTLHFFHFGSIAIDNYGFHNVALCKSSLILHFSYWTDRLLLSKKSQ